MRIYYVDNQFVDSKKAVIPVDDLAVLRGFGVCDIMRTFNKKPFLLKAHIQRLENSARKIGLDLPWSKKELSDIVLKTLEKNQLENEVNIRVIITGGSSSDFFNPQGKPRLIILVTDMAPLPSDWYTKGIKVITLHQERALPDAKVISYIPAALALKKAEKEQAVEAVYVNPAGHVLEGCTSNLFAVFNGQLCTPADGVLKGTTRKAVIKMAESLCPIQERSIDLKDILKADEVFITGTNKGIVPVIQIDDTRIGTGSPGRLTKQLMTALENHFTELSG